MHPEGALQPDVEAQEGQADTEVQKGQAENPEAQSGPWTRARGLSYSKERWL